MAQFIAFCFSFFLLLCKTDYEKYLNKELTKSIIYHYIKLSHAYSLNIVTSCPSIPLSNCMTISRYRCKIYIEYNIIIEVYTTELHSREMRKGLKQFLFKET